MSHSSTLRRTTTAMLSLPLTAIVALAPLPALADGSIADSAFQLRAPMSQMSTGMKLRGYVSLQDPAAAPEGGDPAAAPPPEAAPAGPPPPGYGPPPPGYYGPPPPQSQPPPRGLGMLISGSVVSAAVGLPFTIFGAYTIVASRAVGETVGGVEGAATCGLGTLAGGMLLVFGLIGLGVGVPLAVVGGIRLGKYNAWKRGQQPQAQLMPYQGRTTHGTWTTGLTLKF
jgi:hypothetical protein